MMTNGLRVGLFLQVLGHEFKLFLILLKVSLQILYILVFIVNCSLKPSHGKHKLLDLETKLIQFVFEILIFSRLRIETTSTLQFLLVVGKLEAFLLEVLHSALQVFVLSLQKT